MSRLDSIDPHELAERLRAARSSAGLTQEDAASSLGMARTTLVAIERAQRRVRPAELLAFSRVYEVSTNHLLRPSSVQVDLVPRFRRSRTAAVSDAASAQVVRLLSDLVSASVELEHLVGKPLRPHYPSPHPLRSGDVEQQAEDAALALRSHLGLGLNPIPDIVSILELELGIRVFVRPIHSSISGVFGYSPEAGAAILLNAKHPRERRAVTGGHECGHLMGDRNAVEVYREDEAVNTREERFATYFGLSFLMPAPAIRRHFREVCAEDKKFSTRHLILMAHSFYVSPEAMCRWLEALRLLPKGRYESLRERGFSGESVRRVLGDRVREQNLVAPPRLALLAAEAYHAGTLSEGQISELLRLDRVEVRRLLDAFGDDDDEARAVAP